MQAEKVLVSPVVVVNNAFNGASTPFTSNHHGQHNQLLLLDRMKEYKKILLSMNSMERWLLEIVQRGYHCKLSDLQDRDPKQTKMFRMKGGRLLDSLSFIPNEAWIEEIAKTDLYSNYIEMCRELALSPIQNITFFKELPKLIPIITQIEKYRMHSGEKIMVLQDIKHKISPCNVLNIYRQNRQQAREQQQQDDNLLSSSSNSVGTTTALPPSQEDYNRPYITYIFMPTLNKCLEILLNRYPMLSYCCILNNSASANFKAISRYSKLANILLLDAYYKLYPPTFYIINGCNYLHPNFDKRYLSYLNLDHFMDDNQFIDPPPFTLINSTTTSAEPVLTLPTMPVQRQEEKQQKEGEKEEEEDKIGIVYFLYDTNRFITRYLLDNQCEVSLLSSNQIYEEHLIDIKRSYYDYIKRYGLYIITILNNNPSINGGFENRSQQSSVLLSSLSSSLPSASSHIMDDDNSGDSDNYVDHDQQVSRVPQIKTLLRGSNKINKINSVNLKKNTNRYNNTQSPKKKLPLYASSSDIRLSSPSASACSSKNQDTMMIIEEQQEDIGVDMMDPAAAAAPNFINSPSLDTQYTQSLTLLNVPDAMNEDYYTELRSDACDAADGGVDAELYTQQSYAYKSATDTGETIDHGDMCQNLFVTPIIDETYTTQSTVHLPLAAPVMATPANVFVAPSISPATLPSATDTPATDPPATDPSATDSPATEMQRTETQITVPLQEQESKIVEVSNKTVEITHVRKKRIIYRLPGFYARTLKKPDSPLEKAKPKKRKRIEVEEEQEDKEDQQPSPPPLPPIATLTPTVALQDGYKQKESESDLESISMPDAKRQKSDAKKEEPLVKVSIATSSDTLSSLPMVLLESTKETPVNNNNNKIIDPEPSQDSALIMYILN